jgi:DNA modification methylase
MKNQLICGNNVEVLRTFPDECIDLTVTSPPYDNLRDYNEYSFDFEGLAEQLYRVTKKGGVVVWVVGDAVIDGSESGTSFRQALHFKEIGFNLHDTMIYNRQSRFPDKTRYRQLFEYMFILSKERPKTINIKKDIPNIEKSRVRMTKHRNTNGEWIKRKIKTGDFHDKGNIWRYKVGGGKTTNDKIAFNHPAIFPEKLAEDHITSWSNEGDIVLDPFVGSGTTAKMAKYNKRKYIGIDISQEYLDIAKQRLSQSIL